MPARCLLVLLAFGFCVTPSARSAEPVLRQISPSADRARVTVQVHVNERSTYPIPKNITGKFAEHLGFNIYNGMDAQILRNPTFADYPFWNGRMTPDGVTEFQTDEKRIEEELRQQATRFGWPHSELDGLVQAQADALAPFWTRFGSRTDVQVSPDTGPHGGRAQRVEVQHAGQGIAQWTWLPLHRQREFQFEIMARSPALMRLTIALRSKASEQPLASATIEALSGAWQIKRGKLLLPAGVASDASYQFTITADAPGQFVIRHALLRPADHIHGADPDVVRLLRASHLPLLRWPGGNFVSTYHWQDGVGPIEQRPTKPNYAWGAIEPNTFGTDEFIAFCQAVGCEPMICVNAGSGSPEEAAQWMEYCNGPASSPMGGRRAAFGHPAPFDVAHWEAGNELWGHWQMNWTTARGYVDRFQQFAPAMRAADRHVTLYACGAPAMSGQQWNDTLIAGAGSSFSHITDHPLIGGTVSPAVLPLDVYRDFMAVPEVLQRKWAELRDAMTRGGIPAPRLAVTELQLFAHLGAPTDPKAPVQLTPATLPGQGSMTEAIYDILIYHAAIRLSPFVELITHSAVINHGGGLRKERERVWANPCHYAQTSFAAFANAIPVATEMVTAEETAPRVLPDLKSATDSVTYSVVDALAAIAQDGALLLSLVQRGSAGAVHVQIQMPEFAAGPKAELHILSAGTPWEGNSLKAPEFIVPVESHAAVTNRTIDLELPPYTVARVRVPRL